MGNHLGIQVSKIVPSEFSVEDKIRPARTVKYRPQQSFIHRDVGMAITSNSLFFTQGFLQGLAECNSNVFGGVMTVDVKVPLAGNLEVNEPVKRSSI